MSVTPSSNKRNAAWSAAASVAGPAAQLLAAPYLISTLGKEAYGVILLVNSIVAMSGMTTMGLGDATIKFVAEFAAEGKKEALITLLRTTLFLYLVLGGLTIGVVALAAPFFARSLFNVSPEFIHPAVIAIRIGVCAFVCRLVYSVGESLCRGLRRYDVEAGNAVANSLLVPGLSCLLVFLGYGFTAVVVSYLAVMCGSAIVLAVRCARLIGTGRWLLPSCRLSEVRRLLSYGVFGWFQMIEYVLCSQADRFIVSSRLGAESVPQYAICVQMTQLASGVAMQAFSYIFPAATELYIKARWADLNRLFLTGMQLTTVASFAIAALLFVYGQTILFVWMGNALGNYDRNLVLILASSAALMGTTITQYYLLNGAGYVRLNSVFAMSSMLAILPCSFLFVGWMGVAGMGVAKLMNVFPGLVARAITGRLVLKDRRVLTGVWQLSPTLGGLGILWAANYFTALPAHAAQRPIFALGTVLFAIAVTTMLSLLVYRAGDTGEGAATPDVVPEPLAGTGAIV